MINIPSTNTDPSYRYKMPKVVSQQEGRGNGIKTSVINIKDVAAAIHRPPSYVCKFFGCELGAQSNYTEKEAEGVRAVIMGLHHTSKLQELVDKFLAVFVLCPTCGLPEMCLKVNKKAETLDGKCMACGWGGFLEEATQHKLCKFVIQNPPGEQSEISGKKPGKLSKDERKAARAAKSKKGKHDSDDSDDADGGKKKKKKNKKQAADDSDDSSEKKKKKKDKKEKKEKKEKKSKKKAENDDDSSDDNQENRPNGLKKGSTPDDDKVGHKDEEILDIINGLRCLNMQDSAKQFAEQARMQQLSCQADNKMRMYFTLEALYGEDESKFSKGGIEEYEEHFKAMQSECKVPVKDAMWGIEMFTAEHPNVAKALPLVCKALYDIEVLDEEQLVEYYDQNKQNLDNPGHEIVRKNIAAFVNWLKESSDSDDSDSD